MTIYTVKNKTFTPVQKNSEWHGGVNHTSDNNCLTCEIIKSGTGQAFSHSRMFEICPAKRTKFST